MLPFSEDVKGEWNTSSAGGVIGSKDFFINPMYAMTVTDGTVLQLRCNTTKNLAGKLAFKSEMIASLMGSS
jgi:hypothetical protein